MKMDVIIPTYRPGEGFAELIRRLHSQDLPPDRILIMNTEEQYWNPSILDDAPLLEVHHLFKRDFDHGGTRRAAAALSDADILVFMTQDALPGTRGMLRALADALCKEEKAGAAYARQLPRKEAGAIERYTRTFNYPAVSHVYYEKDIPEHGIKTFFCSNVCAAYKREAYEAAGGFISRTIFGEDMMLAEKMIRLGYGIVYAADAQVIHSHNDPLRRQFARNFDLGVSHAEHPEVYASVPSEGEGVRMVSRISAGLVKTGRFYLLPSLALQSAVKYTGYRAGKRFRSLPPKLVRKLSSNPEYF